MMSNTLGLYFVLIIFVTLQKSSGLDNGLARIPPMGWMSWERFRCIVDCDNYPDECISEKLYLRMADMLVDDGYKDAGYEYVIIDDCWMEWERDENEKLVPDRKRFPNGMKHVADYLHSKGLKFGLYQDFGTKTCAGYPGVINHMELDAKTFAEWDVDYVKLDGCYASNEAMVDGYPEFGRLLNKTGRPMVYSCSWPAYIEKELDVDYVSLKEHCNLWRNWDDIDDSWASVTSITNWFAAHQARLQPAAGPGHWNDPDMLIIGNFGLSYEQAKVQMAIWAILAAPLIMSNDLYTIQPEFREILLNKEIIRVNQDRLGIQGLRMKKEHDIETWWRPISPRSATAEKLYSFAVAFVSHRTDGAPYAITVHLNDVGLTSVKGYYMTDLFDNTVPARHVFPSDQLEVRINPTGVQFYKFKVL